MPRYTQKEVAKWVEAYRDSKAGYYAIARKFNVGSHNTVAAAIKRAGVAVKRAGGQVKEKGKVHTWTRRIATNGYVNYYGWVSGEKRYAWKAEHRLVMEKLLGRPLAKGESVHHKNGNRQDNNPGNLELRVSPDASGASHCPHCGKSFTLELP